MLVHRSHLCVFLAVLTAVNPPKKKSDPLHEVCDIPVKLADLGNACWTVICQES